MAHDLASEVTSARSDKRLATTSWTQLRSPGGAPIPTGDRPVLAVIAGFIRHINPLQYSRSFGTQLYESPEHEGMADNVRLRINATGDTVSSSYAIPLTNGNSVSYQQTIALAGDFYGDPDNPISDGTTIEDQKQRFLVDFESLDNGSPTNMTNILAVMQQQAADVNGRAGKLHGTDPYSQAFTAANAGHKYDKLYNQASGGSGDWDWLLDKGSYLQLAATNWDHFGAHAVTAYKAGHAAALESAAAAARESAAERQGALLTAYLMDAFASHFLADLFSSGHIRTPRKSLHTFEPFPDLLSQMMHDEDSFNGLMATSVHGDAQTPPKAAWPVFGDKRMLDAVNGTNLAFAQQALQASCDEIWNAFANPTASIDPSTFRALDYIPTPVAPKNWPPLFHRDDGNSADPTNDPADVDFRLPVDDLDSTNSMEFSTLGELLIAGGILQLFTDVPDFIEAQAGSAHLAYFAIWLVTPNGGVHSIEGGPPGYIQYLNQFAQPFQWAASYALTNQNQAPIAGAQAPSAAVSVTSLVDDGHAIDDATHANDVLHLFFKDDSSIQHLTTPMSVVTNQPNAGQWSPGCTVETLNLQIDKGSQVAAVETGGVVTIVFPDSSKTWRQAVITPQAGMKGPQPVFAQPLQGVQIGAVTPALVSIGSTLLFFFTAVSPATTYYAIGTPPANNATGASPFYTWSTPYFMQLGQRPVGGQDDPGVIAVGNYVYVSFGGPTSSGPHSIVIYRCLITALRTPSWELYLNGMYDTSGNPILTQSFARLFHYADGYVVVGVEPHTNNLFTAVPLFTGAPKQGWNKKLVSVPSPQILVSGDALTLTTRTTPSGIFYGGNPYLFFADYGSTDLSMVTSNPPHTNVTLK